MSKEKRRLNEIMKTLKKSSTPSLKKMKKLLTGHCLIAGHKATDLS